MSHELESIFRCFQFDAAEEAEAVKYTPLQRMYLQNKLGEAAHAKVNLMVDPTMPADFMQQEAYLTGKIDLLKELLFSGLEAQPRSVD